jgi:undecaprenyl-diphosphatase
MEVIDQVITGVLNFLINFNPILLYFLISLLAYLECAAFFGVFVPGETFVVLAGILASKGLLEINLLIPIVGIAAHLGDISGYYLGKKFGFAILDRAKRLKLILPDHLNQASEFLKRYGSKTIIVARFIGFLRAVAPFLMGAALVPLKDFLVYDLIGSFLWATFFLLGGFYLGESFTLIERYLGRAGSVAILVILGFVFGRKLILNAVKTLETARKRYLAEIWLSLSFLSGLGLLVYLGREAREYDILVEMKFLNWLVALRNDWLTLIFTLLTSLGSGYFVFLFVVGAVFVFLLRKRYFDALLFSLAVVISTGLGSLLKLIIKTGRPNIPLISVPLYSFSFPSGHVIASSIVFWVLGWIIFREAQTSGRYLALFFFLLPLGVGFSRLYFGYHWPVDIAGGYAVAFIIFSFWVYFYEQGRRRRGEA